MLSIRVLLYPHFAQHLYIVQEYFDINCLYFIQRRRKMNVPAPHIEVDS